MVGDCARGRRLRAGATASFIALWYNNRGKVVGLSKCCKKA
jgi:hypothetical protein